MKFSTFSEKENPYMKRKEVVIRIEHQAAATPSNAGLQQLLAKEWGVEPEQVDIKGIYTLVGRQASRASIFLWQEKKVANLAKPPEPEKPAEVPKEEKKEAPKEEKPKEAPKEEKKEEKPAEAPKEEAKPKEKPVEKKEEAPKEEASKEKASPESAKEEPKAE